MSKYLYQDNPKAMRKYLEKEELLVEIGVNIRKFRKKKNYTQLDLAVVVDIHRTQIARIERGEHNVGVCTLMKIANALGVHVKELILDDQSKVESETITL